MTNYRDVCETAVRAGGRALLHWRDRFAATEKGPRDLVTEADLASQAAVRQILLTAFPDHKFIGEEDFLSGEVPTAEQRRGEYCWYVDPLDGTANYVHGLPGYAVSVALVRRDQPIAAAVWDPLLDECYAAALGEGAWLNGQRLHASHCRRLQDAMVATSFPTTVPRGSPEIARFVEVLLASQGVRRLGSAALNLCYVAAGRLDAYFATSVKTWDIAAGMLLVHEAGGVCSDIDGGRFDLYAARFAVAATADLHSELLAILARVPTPTGEEKL